MPSIQFNILNQLQTPALYASSLATRPAFGFLGRIFIDTDSPSTGLYRDTGTSWIQIADPGAGTTGTLQQVTTNGKTSNQGISITANGLGIGTTTPNTNRLDIHAASGLQATFNGTGTANSSLQLQNAGVGKWNLTNNYNAGANDFQIFDVLNSISRLNITNAGEATFLTPTFNIGSSAINSTTINFTSSSSTDIKFVFDGAGVTSNYTRILFNAGGTNNSSINFYTENSSSFEILKTGSTYTRTHIGLGTTTLGASGRQELRIAGNAGGSYIGLGVSGTNKANIAVNSGGDFLFQSAANNIFFEPVSYSAFTGRVNINGATDNSANAINVTGKGLFSDRLQATNFKTNSAQLTVAALTPTTLFAATINGSYQVYSYINANNAAAYASIATVIVEGGTARISVNNGTNLILSLSGLNIQVTHSGSATEIVFYTWLIISA